MNPKPHLVKLLVLLTFAFSTGQAIPAIAQDNTNQGLGIARLIKPTEQVQMTFHRAVLKNGQPQQSDANTYLVSDTLTEAQVEAGFKTGEVVVVRIKSPFPYYIYIVNASEWDGTTLQYPTVAAENAENAANQIKDFAFALENPTSKPATGREELLVMITKSKIDSPQLTDIIGKQGKIEITPVQVEVAKKELHDPLASNTGGGQSSSTRPSSGGTNKWVKALSIGCSAASIFFPFAKLICNAIPGQGGFGVARYVRRGNTAAVAPASDTDRLTFRLSFPVAPQS